MELRNTIGRAESPSCTAQQRRACAKGESCSARGAGIGKTVEFQTLGVPSGWDQLHPTDALEQLPWLFPFQLPCAAWEFPDETLRSGELLNMIVAVIDSFQLQELVCHVMMGNLVMFRKDSVLNILIQSLDWETFEQYCTWQLFLAHSIPLETIIPILQHLKYKDHPEALSCLLLQLRREKPSEEMVKMVLSRPCHPDDQFTTSILRHWCIKHDDLLAEHIKSLLIKNNSLPRKRQSLRSSSSKLAQLTLEQILEHLDNLRLNLTNTKQNFFSQTPILQALQHVQASCDEAHKMKFSDLFSLAEEYEDSSSKPPKSRRKAPLASPRSRKSAAQPPNTEEESASSSASVSAPPPMDTYRGTPH
uniref:Ints3-like C-terminal domain-containing protein n=1 Tax=Amazona collaria TaxID=241587 RepID=A0A8B9FYG5_9PSIT